MTDASPSSPRRALVLGGGGVAGIAWHLGVLAELLDQGIRVDDADLVVGTSAGSVAGSVLRSGRVETVYELQATAPDLGLPEGDTSLAPIDMSTFQQQIMALLAGSTSPQEARARLGTAALAMTRPGSESVLIPTMAAQFPPQFGWPPAPLGICVVNAKTGEFRVLDTSSGVELSRAVAASCSVPLVFPPVEIDGEQYVDGGMRSATNADVAEGYDKVLVLSCGPEDPGNPLGPQLDAAVADLRSKGAEVLVVGADEASVEAFGGNSLADASRIPSALAGRAQGAGAADQVRSFWG